MFTSPGPTPVANPGVPCPLDPMDATVESVVDHCADALTSLEDPSLYPAVALNCKVDPTCNDAAVGVNETDCSTGCPPPPDADEEPPHDAASIAHPNASATPATLQNPEFFPRRNGNGDLPSFSLTISAGQTTPIRVLNTKWHQELWRTHQSGSTASGMPARP